MSPNVGCWDGFFGAVAGRWKIKKVAKMQINMYHTGWVGACKIRIWVAMAAFEQMFDRKFVRRVEGVIIHDAGAFVNRDREKSFVTIITRWVH